MRRLVQPLPSITNPGDLIIGDPTTGDPIIISKGTIGDALIVNPSGNVVWSAGGSAYTFSDTASINLTLIGTTVTADAIFGTTAGTVAQGNHNHDSVYSLLGHNHTGVYQPLDSDLTTIAGLTATTNNFMVASGSAWASRTPAQAIAHLGLDADIATLVLPASTTISAFGATLTDDVDATAGRGTLGLGTIATQSAASVSITGGSITGITDLAIADGGTGQSTAQTAINALTAVAGATNEHVLTKDTASGNAIFKVAAAGGGSGDVVGPAASVDSEIAIYSGTTGKVIKRATNTGLIKAASGVIATATAGTDYYNPGGTDVAVADGGTGASTAAAAATNLGLGTGDSPQFTGVNVGAATDTTITRASAGQISVEGNVVSLNNVTLAHSALSYEVGHATDTTITRLGAGSIGVEGVEVALNALAASHFAGTFQVGHASDTTLARASAGDLSVEGNALYRAGGTDVPITDGGTGQSTAQNAINALTAVSGATNEHVLTKDTGTGNALWKASSAAGGTGTTNGPFVLFLLRTDNTTSPGNAEWTNMGAAANELFNLASPSHRKYIDLSGQSEANFTIYLHVAGATGSIVYLEYTTDLTGATGWTALGGLGVFNLSLTSTGWVSSGWVSIAAGAKAPVLLRVMGSGGNGTADPQFLSIAAQFRGTSGSGDVFGPSSSVDGEAALFSGAGGKTIKRSTLTGIIKQTSGVSSVAAAGTDYYNPGGTDVSLADGGTGASLTDPGADRIMFWDDSAGAMTWLTAGTGLTITGTQIDAAGGGDVGDYLVGRFMLPADAGAAIGPAIANFFGTNSALQLAATTRYKVHGILHFLKTTAEALTLTLTTSTNVIGARGRYIGTAATGGSSAATSGVNAQLTNPGAATAIAYPPTPSLTTAVDHTLQFWAIVETNTACNIRVNVTQPAGTCTPRKWSYYEVWAVSSGNLGTFVA